MPDECVILAEGPGALVELCGISTLERLLRTLQRCGITRATILSTTPAEIAQRLGQPSWACADLEFTIHERPPGSTTVQQIVDLWPETAERVLVIQGDVVFDIRLVRALLAKTSSATLIDSAPDKFCGAALLQREWAAARNGSIESALIEGLKQHTVEALDVANQPLYHSGLRRNLKAFWFPAPAVTDKRTAERILLDSVQKGTLDFPAWIHAPIEKFLLKYLCRTSVTPNQLTISWAFAAFLTTFFFAAGHLIWGIVLALIVGILDGLDGKQARIKVETTAGGKIEHHLDSFFDVVWPTALAYHFYASGQLPTAFYYLAVLLIAEGVDGIAKAIIYSAYARLMTAPGLFDRTVRLIGGRRNIYIWVLVVAVLLGAPAKALIVMAWWEAITAAIDIPHAIRAAYLRRKTPH
ncbi:MAG: CDP-alcohol phosphatidyltransferase family protein [Verrucomicrobiota bacterium]|nr:CDP-alcohol phosphatidyltransferase family protein [Verrucomicrobiota bacterium]